MDITAGCHICGSRLEPKLDFGHLPLANAFLSDPNQSERFYYGLWAWCSECQLLQLVGPPSAAEMFTADYPYKTSTSAAMLQHFKDTADALDYRYDPVIVAEIGVSDGGMIQFLPREQCAVIGFEPSSACWESLNNKRIPFFTEFNRTSVNAALQSIETRFQMIYSANTLRSIPDLGSLLSVAADALDPQWGVLIIEEPYLPSIIEHNEFDQFYDENVYCFTATSMSQIAKRYGLRLFDVEQLPTHGGSVRYHLCLAGDNRAASEGLVGMLMSEAELVDDLDDFVLRSARAIQDFLRELLLLKDIGHRVVGYGATAKSSTCLFAIRGAGLIQCIYDNTPAKIGKYTPGTHIPVRDAAGFINDDASVVVLLAWNHAEEIIERENAIRPRKWLVYAPKVRYL